MGFVSFIGFYPSLVIRAEELKENSEYSHQVRKESFLKDISLYILKEMKPSINLKARELVIDHHKEMIYIFSPKGIGRTNSGEAVNYLADQGRFNQKKEHLLLEGNAQLKRVGVSVNADNIEYFIKGGKVNARKSVRSRMYNALTKDKISIDGDTLQMDVNKGDYIFEGNVKGVIKKRRRYEQSIDFTTKKLRYDELENKIELTEDVFLKKRDIRIWSRRGEIFLENRNKKLKYFSLYDDVRVKEKVLINDGSTILRKAFSEQLEGILKEEKLVLTGSPKVFQEGSVISGIEITLREDSEVIEVDDANTKFKMRD